MDALITLYNDIRKIPYKIVDIEYNLINSYKLIRERGASCAPKHVVLGDWLEGLQIEYKFMVHEFEWKDFQVSVPEKLKNLMDSAPKDYHTNLKVKIDDNWIILDATWDDSLIRFGFPGTINWNGKSDTNNGVYSLKQYEFSTFEDRTDFVNTMKQKNTVPSPQESDFINELNTFFSGIRSEVTGSSCIQ